MVANQGLWVVLSISELSWLSTLPGFSPGLAQQGAGVRSRESLGLCLWHRSSSGTTWGTPRGEKTVKWAGTTGVDRAISQRKAVAVRAGEHTCVQQMNWRIISSSVEMGGHEDIQERRGSKFMFPHVRVPYTELRWGCASSRNCAG